MKPALDASAAAAAVATLNHPLVKAVETVSLSQPSPVELVVVSQQEPDVASKLVIKQKFKFLGIFNANPDEYVIKYGNSLVPSIFTEKKSVHYFALLFLLLLRKEGVFILRRMHNNIQFFLMYRGNTHAEGMATYDVWSFLYFCLPFVLQ